MLTGGRSSRDSTRGWMPWRGMTRRSMSCFALLFLLSLCQGCEPSVAVQTVKIPDWLLVPERHPQAVEPYTVQTLLIIIGEYESSLERANDKLAAIEQLQK